MILALTDSCTRCGTPLCSDGTCFSCAYAAALARANAIGLCEAMVEMRDEIVSVAIACAPSESTEASR